MDIEDIIH